MPWNADVYNDVMKGVKSAICSSCWCWCPKCISQSVCINVLSSAIRRVRDGTTPACSMSGLQWGGSTFVGCAMEGCKSWTRGYSGCLLTFVVWMLGWDSTLKNNLRIHTLCGLNKKDTMTSLEVVQNGLEMLTTSGWQIGRLKSFQTILNLSSFWSLHYEPWQETAVTILNAIRWPLLSLASLEALSETWIAVVWQAHAITGSPDHSTTGAG